MQGAIWSAAVLAVLLHVQIPAEAQGLRDATRSSDAVLIEADQGIEWRRNDQVYEARGNAVAIRGGLTVKAQVLRAFYRETEPGHTDIFMMEAVGNVTITSKGVEASGDRAVYDVATGRVVLSGQDVQLDTPQYQVFADGNLEYYENENYAVATGGAKAVSGDRQVRADSLFAYFLPSGGEATDADVERLVADGNMVIVTASEIVHADRGTYFPQTEIATAVGDVQITRGDTQLNGEEAEVNMVTGVSTIKAGSSGGRVLGLFTPGSLEPVDRPPEN
jgi:lipopolysaccharide export system protein LptA